MFEQEQGTLSAAVSIEMMMAVVIIFLLAIILLIYFFHLRKNRYPGPNPITFPISGVRFSLDSELEGVLRRGLDRAVIQALPVTIFRSEELEEGDECAVCLSELLDGEMARVLPKCNHGFHLECIDVWLRSNRNCPLCRSPVCSELPQSTHVVDVYVPPLEESSEESTGASTTTRQESSSSSSEGSSEGMLVIEIPRQVIDDGLSASISPLQSSSSLPAEEMSSPWSVKLRSPSGLVNEGSRGIATTCSAADVEQC